MMKKITYTLKIKGQIYLGHPLAEKYYLTNLLLKVKKGEWLLNISKLKDTIVGIKLVNKAAVENKLVFDQERKIKGSDALMVADGQSFSKLSEEDLLSIHRSCEKLRANEDFLPFELYAERIQNTPLKPLDELKELSPEEAQLYIKMRDLYDEDIKYSNKEILYWDHLLRDDFLLACYEDPINFLIKIGHIDNEVNAIYIDATNN